MEIQIFSNSKFGQLRVALNENGETVFCLADVCKALGIVEPSRVKERLDSSNLHSVKVSTKSSNRHGEFTRITTMTYIGRQRLFKWLRENGYIFKQSREPMQKWIERGIMTVRECWVTTDHGMELAVTPMITGKGQEYFLNLFCGEK